jgi:hypothetical protein
MTDPQDDVPCTACETEGARSRLDDDGLCPGCRTAAGRLLTELSARGIKATDTGNAIRVPGVKLTLVPGYDNGDPWGILGKPDGTDQTDAFAAAIAAIVQAPGMREAIRAIAAAIGTPADVDPLADLPGLVLMVQAMVQRAESSAIVLAEVER